MIGKIISHYKILEKIGEGGMGVVYKARDTKLDREVALKFLPHHLDASAEDISRFEQEAKAISALNHPHIETIYDVDEIDDQKYLVLEYIPGGTLKSKLKQLKSEDKTFSIADVLNYSLQLAEGLAHAHRHQIIHRDIKTENILLTEEGKVKLTDFGLAKLRGTVHKTKTGSTLGTVAYMSPEQIRGEEVGQQSDLWSLGVVLYELLTSHLPFPGEYEAAVSYGILNQDPSKVRSVRPETPPDLENIIDRCLEKDKTKRYQQAEDIFSDLRAVQQQTTGKVQVEKKRTRLPLFIGIGIVLLVVIILSYLFIKPKTIPVQNKSIAVLPFKNLSDSKEDEYFSDGITEDILTQLSKISDLNVISRTTIMQYKNSQKSLKQIGQELKVGVVLEGSVRHAGDRIRISSQLIDAGSDRHLWAETYDRQMKDVFAIQSDVAKQIAAALKANLSLGEKNRIERGQTENTEAYQLYLKGRFYWNKRTVPDLQKSIRYFNQAIEKDPTYALAYAGSANSLVILPAFGISAKECYPKAQQAAHKALEFDSTLAEAHTVLAQLMESRFEWMAAESRYKRAIELNPNYPTAHQWYGTLLSRLGRYDEAIYESRRAAELDPLSLIINYSLCYTLFSMRQYDEAKEHSNKGIELDPNFPWSYYIHGLVNEAQGKYDEALKDFTKLKLLAPNDPTLLGEIGRLYGWTGRKDEAWTVLRELQDNYKKGYSVCSAIANVYHGLGDKEKSFEWLERSIHDQEGLLIDIMENPLWDDLRADPRFIALLRKMGLEK
jgi:serine/threonine protein kinase/Tfp pilus assembly protein PilF